MKSIKLNAESQIAVDRLCAHEYLDSICSPKMRRRVLNHVVALACEAVWMASPEVQDQFFHGRMAVGLVVETLDPATANLLASASEIMNGLQEAAA